MDSTTFDAVARFFGHGMTRRTALRGLGAGVAAVAAGTLLQQTPEAEARRRRARKRHKHAETCGRQDDGCGAKDEHGEYTAPYCCHGYACVYHPDQGSVWTCEVVT